MRPEASPSTTPLRWSFPVFTFSRVEFWVNVLRLSHFPVMMMMTFITRRGEGLSCFPRFPFRVFWRVALYARIDVKFQVGAHSAPEMSITAFSPTLIPIFPLIAIAPAHGRRKSLAVPLRACLSPERTTSRRITVSRVTSALFLFLTGLSSRRSNAEKSAMRLLE